MSIALVVVGINCESDILAICVKLPCESSFQNPTPLKYGPTAPRTEPDINFNGAVIIDVPSILTKVPLNSVSMLSTLVSKSLKVAVSDATESPSTRLCNAVNTVMPL